MTSLPAEAAYDEVPYTAHAFPETHPARLAATATVLGLSPPTVETARILELGCARGGNLLPMARSLPGATLLGIDISGVQIREAQGLAEGSGLCNLTFEQRDLRTFPEDAGEFDYIICHGVLSWVPEDVRAALFALIGRHLAPQGVAFVSYNVDPGFRIRSLSREILRFYAEAAEGPPLARLAAARAGLLAIAESGEKGAYHDALREEVAILADTSDAYVLHEHLEDMNVPIRFEELAARAAESGLAWLAEAPLPRTWPLNLPGERLAGRPEALLLRVQQEIDLRTGRAFRRSLLIRQAALQSREPRAARLLDLHVRSSLRPDTAVDPRTSEPVTFRTKLGAIEIDDPLSKAAFSLLGAAYPGTRRVRDLAREAYELAGMPPSIADPEHALANDLLELFTSTELIDVLAWGAGPSSTVPERPFLPAFLRQRMGEDGSGTTFFHDNLRLNDPLYRAFVLMLDGTATREQLRARGEKLMASLGLEPRGPRGEPLRSASARTTRIRAIVDEILASLTTGGYFARGEGPDDVRPTA